MSDLQAFERRWLVQLPPQLRHYFMAVDGTGSLCGDNEEFAFWMLSEVRPVRELFESESDTIPHGLFAFADYFLEVHLYAVDLSPGPGAGSVWLVCGAGDIRRIAADLRGFFDVYLADRGLLR